MWEQITKIQFYIDINVFSFVCLFGFFFKFWILHVFYYRKHFVKMLFPYPGIVHLFHKCY